MIVGKFEPEKIKSYPVWLQINHGEEFTATLAHDRVMFKTQCTDNINHIRYHLYSILRSLNERYPNDNILIDGQFINGTVIVYDASIPGSYESRWNTLTEYIDIEPTQGSDIQLISYSVHDDMESLTEEYLRLNGEGIDAIMTRDPREVYIERDNDVILDTDTIRLEYPIPSDVRILHLKIRSDHRVLIKSKNDRESDSCSYNIIKWIVTHTLLPRLETIPDNVELRFRFFDEERQESVGDRVIFMLVPNFRMWISSYTHDIDTGLLIVNVGLYN